MEEKLDLYTLSTVILEIESEIRASSKHSQSFRSGLKRAVEIISEIRLKELKNTFTK